MVFSNRELLIILGTLFVIVCTIVNYMSFYKAVLLRQFSSVIAYGVMTCALAAGISSNISVYMLEIGGKTPVSIMDLIAPFVVALLVMILTGFSIQPKTPENGEALIN